MARISAMQRESGRTRRRRDGDTGRGATLRRLLLVDDEAALLRAGARILEPEFKVETATSAEQAADMLVRRRYDLIVTDYEMPGRHGIWLLELAQQRLPAARRVLVSGSQPPGVELQLLSGVVHRFVEKPFMPSQLAKAVLDALAGEG